MVLPTVRTWLLLMLVVVANGEDRGTGQLDLTKSTIKTTLAALPAEDAVLIEFFASWCPACRAFKPEYEKAAAFLLQHSSVHVYRLDCAIDPDVCDQYKVSGYPTMYVGKSADVAAVAVDKLTKFDYGLFKRSAAGVVQFVAKQLHLDLTYAEEAQDSAAALATQQRNTSTAASAGATKWTSIDVESATRQLFTSITSFHPADGLKERRAALLLLLRLWGAGHPLGHCRSGAASLMQQLPKLWPEDATKDPWGAEQGSRQHPPADVCLATSSAVVPAAGLDYVACKGSTADSRGFTCGLWLLFHTTASRLPENDGGALLVSALQGFAKYFFQCEVCRTHFMTITSTTEAAAVRSRRDGVLWLWKAHNEVNARLQQVESKYGHSSTGDPAFPKVQWPTAADCPLCRLPQPSGPSTASKTDEAEPVQWNSEEVYRYLMQQYGRQPDDAHSIKAAPVSTQRSIDGGSAIMQAALEADEAAKATAGPFRWLTTTAGMCTLLLVAVALVGVMRHVGSGGRSSGMKGAQRYMNGRHGRGAPLRIRAGF